MLIRLIRPSDAKAWRSCASSVWLDNKLDFERAPIEGALEQLINKLGVEHEQAVLNKP